jgi:hypothetical protein
VRKDPPPSRWKTCGLFLALSLLACRASPASAQTIRGQVLDNTTGLPIPAAYVELIGADGEMHRSHLANDEGWFEFRDLAEGFYRLSGEQLGYENTVSGFIAVKAGDDVQLEFRMAVEAILLEPLTVTASPRPWYEHLEPPGLWEYYERKEQLESLGIGRFLGREELDRLGAMPVTHAIATIPGMRTVASDTRGGRVHLLGRRGCDAMFFLNGMEVRLRPTLFPADTGNADFVPTMESLEWYIDDFVSLSDVEAIEVYRGPSELPGEFHGMHTGGNCGAVVVWTKRTLDIRREH